MVCNHHKTHQTLCKLVFFPREEKMFTILLKKVNPNCNVYFCLLCYLWFLQIFVE